MQLPQFTGSLFFLQLQSMFFLFSSLEVGYLSEPVLYICVLIHSVLIHSVFFHAMFKELAINHYKVFFTYLLEPYFHREKTSWQ